MVIASYNVNGLRSAMKKGFLEWADKSKASVICIQELRAQEDQINTDSLKEYGWNYELFPAIRRGYAGTAILSREPMSEVRRGEGDISAGEGRIISAKIGDLRVCSVYVPSGSAGSDRQEFKMRWLDGFSRFYATAAQSESIVLCGDFNICREEEDIHNPKGLSGASGFLPEERSWFQEWLAAGFSDSFRAVNPGVRQYTWWSMRGQARRKNLGWRIDYAILSARLKPRLMEAWIDPSPACSDHCPTLVKLGG